MKVDYFESILLCVVCSILFQSAMAFLGVEIEEGEDAGTSLAVVNKLWLTPRKKELLWPPYKTQDEYDKALKRGEKPNQETWQIYKINRCFFETDEFKKAKKKIKLAEVCSDVQSEFETSDKTDRRSQHKPQRFDDYYVDGDKSSDSDDTWQSKLPRPKINQNKLLTKNDAKKNCSLSRDVTVATPPCILNNNDVLEPLSNIRDEILNTPTSSRSSNLSSSSTLTLGDSNAYKILEYLAQIKEQNKQILALMQKNDMKEADTPGLFPENIPVSLPLKTIEDLETLELFLSERKNSAILSSYLATLGGKEVVSKTNTALKRCISNRVASLFNFFGKRNNKRAFNNLNLCKVIVDAVKLAAPQGTDKEIEGFIKCWLKHSPQRLSLETKNKNLPN